MKEKPKLSARHSVPILLILSFIGECLPSVQVRYAPGPDRIAIEWISHWPFFTHYNPFSILVLLATILAAVHAVLLFRDGGQSRFLYVMTLVWSAAGALFEGIALFGYTVWDASWQWFLSLAIMILLAAAALMSVIFRRSMRFED